MSDLFHAKTRSTDPHTSFEAADAVSPKIGTIREQVLAFAQARGNNAFIDEELSDHFKDEGSSYRSRRHELTEENWILDTGRMTQNRAGLNCVLWIHRDFYTLPPPVKPRREAAPRRTREEALAMADELEGAAPQMRYIGRAAFADQLLEAARIMRDLAR